MALFRRFAKEQSFTDEMIKMLPSQGEHGPAPCSHQPGWLSPYGEPECAAGACLAVVAIAAWGGQPGECQ